MTLENEVSVRICLTWSVFSFYIPNSTILAHLVFTSYSHFVFFLAFSIF